MIVSYNNNSNAMPYFGLRTILSTKTTTTTIPVATSEFFEDESPSDEVHSAACEEVATACEEVAAACEEVAAACEEAACEETCFEFQLRCHAVPVPRPRETRAATAFRRHGSVHRYEA